MSKKNKNDQIEEVLKNQNYIIEAVTNLNARLEAIEKQSDDEQTTDLKEILESQALIDGIMVNNSDDIALMKKLKQENKDAIKCLEYRIEILGKEIKMRNAESITGNKEEEHDLERKETVCKFYNRGYCKYKMCCIYFHSQNICEIFLKDGKCFRKGCCLRHPKNCKYGKEGCFRVQTCAYLHNDDHATVGDKNHVESCEEKVDHEKDAFVNDNIETMNAMEVENSNTIQDKEITPECGNCKSDKVKNECENVRNIFVLCVIIK